jgi:hypothetical protein
MQLQGGYLLPELTAATAAFRIGKLFERIGSVDL